MPPRLNIPPVTRILLSVLVLQSLLSAAIRYRQWSENSNIVIPYLNLVPSLSIWYPWTFLTTTLVESNIFTLAIAGFTIFNGGRYLERAWSSAEFAKFLVIVALIPNFLTFLALDILFSMTGAEHWALTPIAGTIPFQISFLIAFCQLVPAHTVTLFKGILSMRVPRFPLIYLGLVMVLAMTPLLTGASFFLAVFGFVTSWTYLRFYKTVFPDLDSSQPAALRGDASESFAFPEFFPGPAKPFVATVSNQIFDLLVAVKICTPFSPADVSAARGDNFHLQGRNHGGSNRAEAERRRALALKALDQRLHAATANSRTQPPPATTGPTVQTQPQPNTQTAMTSKPGPMLGETSYVPDQDHNEKGGA
ncbi:hypothetical protein MKZ38_006377 [Zalerion maritima]|uniref:Uncharacterized protein n=1 Tax=Zalerion maritima TaxID=339359 RepID=A0AAD5RJY5_9PEZI|nr:hypothetical protein MKZ38_006377 [Zalerion maritima]